jgi:23S rRNA pseudouridine1911/1915/1917 synthase
MEETVTLEAESSGERLDVFVARRCPGLSRSLVQRLIREGRVTVGGRPGRAGQRLERGDRVLVRMRPEEPEPLRPEPIPLTILYEDADLLVVDKPAGLTVHPAAGVPASAKGGSASGGGQAGVRRGTLAAALLAYRPELAGVGGPERPGIVHRLDRDTSGLLVVAKSEAARAALALQWKERQVEKGYLALVHGRLEPLQGVIDAPIGRDPRHRQRMAVVEGGRAARTAYRVQRYLPVRQEGLSARQGGRDVYSLVEVTPSTGRTHQIRVHFAALGHPLAGDRVYGRPSAVLGRQFLHAHRLAFRHPVDGRPLEFESPLPEDLRQALEGLAAR